MLTYTVLVVRPAVAAVTDGFGNTFAAARGYFEFQAMYAPAMETNTGLLVTAIRDAAEVSAYLLTEDVLADGDLLPGDKLTIDGVDGWQVFGEPQHWQSPFSDVNAPDTQWIPGWLIPLKKVTG